MPYSNVPEDQWPEMDRCVERVMGQGHAKDSAIAICHASIMGGGKATKAEWDVAYQNDLPDSAFLYVAPGGEKDDDGKTVPRSLRKFPYRNSSGAVDLPHLRNAIARIPQSDVPADKRAALQERARKILRAEQEKAMSKKSRRQHLTTAQTLALLADDPADEAALLGVALYDADEAPGAEPQVEAEEAKDMHGMGMGMGDMEMPAEPMAMAPPSSLEELAAQRVASAQAMAVEALAGDYHTVVSGIMANPTIEDKGAAIVAEAGVFKRMLGGILSGAKALGARLKVGARHSAKDNEAIQGIHDGAVMLGAMCQKAAQRGSAFAVFKDRKGQDRWIGVFTNNFEDKDGETLTEAAHKEFMAHLDAHPEEAPEWFTYHEDVGHKSRADFWDYVDGFVLMSGSASPEDAARYAALAQKGRKLGMSHEFRCTKQGRIIVRYRSSEVSDLPVDQAANPYTEFTVIGEGAKSMTGFTPEKRKYFVDLYGEEMAARFEAEAQSRAKALADEGVRRKAATPPALAENAETMADMPPDMRKCMMAAMADGKSKSEAEAMCKEKANSAKCMDCAADEPTPAPAASAAPEPAAPAVAAEAVDVAQLKATLVDALGIPALVEAVAKLTEITQAQVGEIAGLKQGLDAEVAKALSPRVAPAPRGVTASAAPETALAQTTLPDGTVVPLATPEQAAALKNLTADGYAWVKEIGPLV